MSDVLPTRGDRNTGKNTNTVKDKKGVSPRNASNTRKQDNKVYSIEPAEGESSCCHFESVLLSSVAGRE